ncbi:MAG: nucleotidyltransferase family protein [Candidatus Levybacteria bacterium]|nr:nucleotidyltransferase family protein [Candidatus Levybacteria bacterium]
MESNVRFKIQTIGDINELIRKDPWMMEVLQLVESLGLPDWMIGAGFARNKVWDHLHEYSKRSPLTDIDVIYFDPADFSDSEASSDSTRKELEYQKILTDKMPDQNWSVTNQARMHHFHKREPYRSSEEALSEWVETATCVGVTLRNGKPFLIAPHGVDDLVGLKLVPVFRTDEKIRTFHQRVEKKNWLAKWPKLKVVDK